MPTGIVTLDFTTDQNIASARGSKVKLKKLTVEHRKNGSVVVEGQSQKPNRSTPPFRLELDKEGASLLREALA